jgi:hypothetical protein
MGFRDISVALKIQADVNEYYREMQRLKSNTDTPVAAFSELAKKSKEAAAGLASAGAAASKSRSGYAGIVTEIEKTNSALAKTA